MKPSELATVMEFAIQNKKPLIIVGPPGIGKTDIITQVAEKLNRELMVMYPTTSDPTDFRGLPVLDPETGRATFMPFDELWHIIEAGGPTVVLLDDFGQANPSVQAACMHMLLARHIGSHAVSEHVSFMIASNDRTHHAGVAGILEPVKSRAMSIIHLKADLEDWISWALNNDIAPEVIAYMRFRGNQMLSDFQPTSGFTNSPSPRGQVAVSDIIKAEFPTQIEHELIKGACGEAYANEIKTYLNLYRHLPDPVQVLRNPGNVEVPEDPMIIFAYCGALASMASRENIDQIVAFARRLPIEYQVKLLAYDCKHKDPSIQETGAYVNWITENQRYLTAA